MAQYLTADFLLRIGETDDVSIDYTGSGASTSNPIESSTWIVPTGITNASDSSTDTVATIFIDADTVGTGVLTNTVTLDGGQIVVRRLIIRVVS